MGKKQTYKSPLARLEHETNKRKMDIEQSRLSITSTYSTDSVSTTGRLLDKLRLADEDWNYDYDDHNDTHNSSVSEGFTDLSTDLSSETSGLDNSTNTSQTSIPASKFRYLKSVLGSTRKNNIQNSAASKALEMGKRINTVEQNVSRVSQRANVRSIHLDNLLHDADESILSFSSEEEEDDEESSTSDQDTINEENSQQGVNPINIPSVNLQDKTHKSDSLSSINLPHTPTRSMMDRTPVNSPQANYRRHTPQNSITATPKQIMGHKHTLSNLSNISYGSHNTDFYNEHLVHNIPPNDDLIFNNKDVKIKHNQVRKPSHNHTQSAVHVNAQNSQVLEDQDETNSSLMRSASVPIRKPSIKQSPVPTQPLPPYPPQQITPGVNHASQSKPLTPPTTSSSVYSVPNSPGKVHPTILHPNQYHGAPKRIPHHIPYPNTHHGHQYNQPQYQHQPQQMQSHKYYQQQVSQVPPPMPNGMHSPQRSQNRTVSKMIHPPASPNQNNVYLDSLPNMKPRSYKPSTYLKIPPHLRSPQHNKQQNANHLNYMQANPTFNSTSSPQQQHFHSNQSQQQYNHIYPSSSQQHQIQTQVQSSQPNFYQGRSPFYKQSPQQQHQQLVMNNIPPDASNLSHSYYPYTNTCQDLENNMPTSMKKSNKYQDVDLSYIIPR